MQHQPKLGEDGLFDCPRRTTLRLSTPSCATSWRSSQKLPKNSFEPHSVCRSCPIGALHAGAPPPAPEPRPRRCCRCGRAAIKFVLQGTICVSCYNRQREVERGCNRRGGVPVKARPMRPYVAINVAEQRVITINRVTEGPEGLLSADRLCVGELLLAYARPPILTSP